MLPILREMRAAIELPIAARLGADAGLIGAATAARERALPMIRSGPLPSRGRDSSAPRRIAALEGGTSR